MSVTILTGDALAVLRDMPSDSIDCCITSPPYWGLRDYGVAGQIGLEPTLGEHLAVMVEIFEEVRRVLKPTGTCWINYGDCYATAPNGRSAADTKAAGGDDRTFRDKPFSTVGPVYGALPGQPNMPANGTGRRGGGNAPAGPIEKTPQGGYPAAEQKRRGGEAPRAHAGPVYEADDSPRNQSRRGRSGNLGNGGVNGSNIPMGRVVAGGYLKPKDLCMLPNRLAIALQDAGWWVRSEIIWGKPNAMPDSSGRYRPSAAHEKIFLLTKSGDADVWVARDTGEISFSPDLAERSPLVTKPEQDGARWVRLGAYYDAGAVRMSAAEASIQRWNQDIDGQAGSTRANAGRKTNGNMKAVGGKQRGHSRRHDGFNNRWDEMSKAEQQANGRLLRNFEPDLGELVPPGIMAWEIAIQGFSGAHFATFPPALVVPCVLAGCPVGGTVLDPFGGAGTTGMVADQLGREAVLIELNHDYAALARDRLRAALAQVKCALPEVSASGGLFGEAA